MQQISPLLLENLENFTLTHGELADSKWSVYFNTILTFTFSLAFTA